MDIQNKIINLVEQDSDFSLKQIKAVISLIDDGNTIPFIARYRKELTDNLDEVQIKQISDDFNYLEKMESRKEDIIKIITEADKMTDKIMSDINKAGTLAALEDIYRPFKVKRKTLAFIAKENGLEPLALLMMLQQSDTKIDDEVKKYVTEDLDAEAVLAGAHEIIAEIIGDNSDLRAFFRKYTFNTGIIESRLKDESKDDRKVYEMYYDYSEKISKVVSHRILALNRAEKAGVLSVNINVSEDEVNNFLYNQFVSNSDSEGAHYVIEGYKDAYKRFIAPAIERELRNQVTEDAENQAIEVFSENLYNLLLQAPIKNQVVMGFDPAFRTGCKLAIIDEFGKLLKIEIIYPHATSQANSDRAAIRFIELVNNYDVDLVAIGNGTASRESEIFVAENIKKVNKDVKYMIVSEAGASVYSASQIARDEFPNLQVEERSAVSIGRRVQDPLAELVKVDPKSIGVGQYQHDISQKALDDQLGFVVENAVNKVGVDINSASAKLLEYISGLNKTVAQNIVTYREENSRFNNRNELKKVPRLGAKSFEQSIGFIRIFDGSNILDSTGIHPESYKVAKQIIKDFKLDLDTLGSNDNNNKLNGLDLDTMAEKYDTGVETLNDIVSSLKEPIFDIRDEIAPPTLRSDVLNIKDLKKGMSLNGTVRNVVDFGVFVDVGLDNDGLVHISKISRKFIKHPSEVLKVGDQVEVSVLDFDVEKGKVQLSMVD